MTRWTQVGTSTRRLVLLLAFVTHGCAAPHSSVETGRDLDAEDSTFRTLARLPPPQMVYEHPKSMGTYLAFARTYLQLSAASRRAVMRRVEGSVNRLDMQRFNEASDRGLPGGFPSMEVLDRAHLLLRVIYSVPESLADSEGEAFREFRYPESGPDCRPSGPVPPKRMAILWPVEVDATGCPTRLKAPGACKGLPYRIALEQSLMERRFPVRRCLQKASDEVVER